jgi:hypothetical protein
MDPQQVSIILGIILIVLQAAVTIVQFIIQQRQATVEALQKDLVEMINRGMITRK